MNKKNEKSVGIIGYGFVGKAVYEGLKDTHDVICYDKRKLPEGVKSAKDMHDLASNCEIVFVCVPTPMKQDGVCDTSIVESVVEELDGCGFYDHKNVAVIKSTVVPGTTRRLHDSCTRLKGVVFNPEFLREASFLEDFKTQDRIILGGDVKCNNIVRDMYRKTFPDVPILKTSSENAELIKYFTNCFLATKVSFANEMYQICQAMFESGANVDYDRIVELATLDKRIGTSHLKVPGPDGLMGWGLSCFPKDLNAMINLARSYDIKPRVMLATWEKNLEVREDKDWERLEKAVTNVKRDK